ncbi:putative cadmium, cobalt and zinc/H(+)-K(+) antiporter [Leptospira broomii serovar Hurstbridge str. 5399]|uniref:Cadmium, cobalt and zinc/H(+)-K(+) antiporter n=1 Tax=Leptospira broomii serovar Hurstbridge str. 5399 TaxID=1049789 RepID=T0FC69_9LEPT|nr:cation diffusion facilitator family transporter [Leptospira broomii]EQA45466.1 putative cadmium, cobalt and zinc/H(+)-K(+) antiporter [Leptospira broomii serovar Hurstbridge str. 5399]
MHGHHHHENHEPHNHDEHIRHSHGIRPDGSKAFFYAFILNFGFAIVELIGGYASNSLAILSDALHDLGDSGFLALAWIFQKIAARPRTQTFTFGYKRLGLSAALVNSIVLFGGSIAIIAFAFPRLQNPANPNGWGMLGLSFLGIIVNGAALLKMKTVDGINSKTVVLHLLEDVLGWVAVLIGSIALLLFGWSWLDPLLSILISIWVGVQSFRNLRKILLLHLQSTPEGIDTKELEKRILSLKGVESIHDLHLWSMDGDYHVLTLHVGVTGTSISHAQKLKEKIRKITKEFRIPHATVEVEPIGIDCPYEEC